MTDTLADTLARLKNATMRGKDVVVLPNVKQVGALLEILKSEKMIAGYELVDDSYEATLLYEEDTDLPLISSFVKVSKPGQRIYVKSSEILPVMNGRGIAVISTSKGLMSGGVAKANKLGGEYICNIW